MLASSHDGMYKAKTNTHTWRDQEDDVFENIDKIRFFKYPVRETPHRFENATDVKKTRNL